MYETQALFFGIIIDKTLNKYNLSLNNTRLSFKILSSKTMKSTNYLARFFCTLLCTCIGISVATASNTAENKALKEKIISGIDLVAPHKIVVPYAGKTIETTAKLIVANLNNGDVANSTKVNSIVNANTGTKIVACQAPACTPVTITKTKSL